MRTKILILLAICAIAFACNKNEYTTKPQLSIKSISSTSIPPGSVFDVWLQVTDKEGDIQDSIWVQKISKICPTEVGNTLNIYYKVPNFPVITHLNGEILIPFSHAVANIKRITLNGCSGKNDSCHLRFWIRDKAGNVSDTLVSPTLVLLKD